MLKQIAYNRAVKEAFDDLPSGICYFNPAGRPVLCNYTMHHLFYALTGNDLQSESELYAALNAPSVLCSHDIYLLPDHRAWKFSFQQVIDEHQHSYTQVTASEVTQLYAKTQKIQQENQKLMEAAAHLRSISQNASALMKEEEILSMKMLVHAKVGESVMASRRYLSERDGFLKKEDILHAWKEIIALLSNENDVQENTDVYQDLLHTAASIGVEIKETGTHPQSPATVELMSAALRECLTNTIRHANGNQMNIVFQQTGKYDTAIITNDGIPPKEEIIEKGGLSSLRCCIEKAGGTMEVQSMPVFSLTVKIPKEQETGS